MKIKARDYQLRVFYLADKTKIKMNIVSDFASTGNFPLTHQILKKRLPSIFASKCFNDKELPFELECQNTETGHLFEHILLEYLAKYKMKNDKKKKLYFGLTVWDWNLEAEGSFDIEIDADKNDKKIFEIALWQSKKLLDEILQSNNQNQLKN